MSDGITVTVKFIFNGDHADGFAATIGDAIKETATRPGFRDIRVVRHRDKPEQVMLIERWDSADAYAAYIEWRRARGDLNKRPAGVLQSQEMDFWTSIASA